MFHPLFIAAAAAPPAKIPDLRPPENPVAPTLWQQLSEDHRNASGVGGVLLLVAVIVLVWWWRRPKPLPAVPPIDVAREQLRQLAARPEDGALAGQVARVLRTYLTAAVRTLPQAELTADEIAGRLPVSAPWLGAELIAEITAFLGACDRLKYSSARIATPLKLAAQAGELVEKVAAKGEAERLRVPPVLKTMASPAKVLVSQGGANS